MFDAFRVALRKLEQANKGRRASNGTDEKIKRIQNWFTKEVKKDSKVQSKSINSSKHISPILTK